MIKFKNNSIFLALVALGALGVLSVPAIAQVAGPGGNQPPRVDQRPGMMMGGGGGGSTMVVDGEYLFILQGNRLLKVHKTTLEVVKQVNLPAPTRPEGADVPTARPGQ